MAQVKAFQLGGIGAPCCCGGTPTSFTCVPFLGPNPFCSIPCRDLTLSWAGGGSATLVWNGDCTEFGAGWVTACIVTAVTFTYNCTSQLTMIVHSVPGCTGSTTTCGYTRNVNTGFSMTSHTCSPFNVVFTVNGSVAGGGCFTGTSLLGAVTFTLS